MLEEIIMGKTGEYTGKVLRVNLTGKNSSTQHIDREVFGRKCIHRNNNWFDLKNSQVR